jgi:uncharacterized protein with HEPN domain
MSRVKELFFFDILVAICKIEHTVRMFKDADELKYNYMAWDSVIREFEIIGEATKNLIESELLDNSQREIVNFRNVLIHEYFGIDEEEVFDIATNKLNDLKQSIVSKIELVESELKQELIVDFMDENKHLDFVVQALGKLN